MPVDKETQAAAPRRPLFLPILTVVAVQVLLVTCALILCVWVKLSVLSLIAIGTSGVGSIAGAITIANAHNSAAKFSLFLTIAGALLVLAIQILPFSHVLTVDVYLSAIAWLLALVAFAP